ncbi:MAG TPA: tetratricopeptide repeat-containing sensor histidine kinase, partial [Prolixibacteraceae bacterium]|nr:tetratricopeptide repeat-containing sensor histidine kinase [Prolixibacteraceae bacterium]
MVLQAEVRFLLAECEKHKGNLKNEFLHLQKAVGIYKSIEDDLHLATIYNRIGYRYLGKGNYKEALSIADSAHNAAKKAVVLTEQAYSLKIKSDAYSGLGKPNDALEAYKAYKEISDSIYNSSVIQAISNVDVLTKTMAKEKELLILSLELEQNRKMRLMIIVSGIVFLIVIAIYNLLLYRRYKKEKQDGLILKEKNQQISEQAENLESLNQKLVLLNKSKDKFHTIIAHDLKSPISAFYSVFELLHHSYDQLSDEDRKSFVDMAYTEVQRIMKLLDNLLAWSRIQGGQMNIRKSNFFIDETVMEIVSALKNMAELKEIAFEINEIEHVKIHADKEMIKAVIRNLCTNAIKFTPRGKKIRIGVLLSGKILEVFVQDDGIGIPKNKLDVLFEIDSKVQRKGTDDEPGTGLGLQLCYEFIKLHKGEITVESVEGQGSCFAFKIPCQC